MSGDIVASSHLELLEDDDSRGRYYLDRLDVSDPENPKMLEQVNISGSLIDTEKWTCGRMTVTADRVFVRQFAIDIIDEDDNSNWTEAGLRMRVFDAQLEPLGTLDVPAGTSMWDDLRARGTRALSNRSIVQAPDQSGVADVHWVDRN